MSGLLLWLSGLVAGLLLPVLFRKREPRINVNENGHWEFPVDTLRQMLAIPAERRERFLGELPSVLRGMWELIDQYPLVTVPGAVWVDDDLGELRPNVVNAPANAGSAFDTRPLKGDA